MRAWICDDTAYVYLLDSSCAALFVFFLRLPSSYSFPFLSPCIKKYVYNLQFCFVSFLFHRCSHSFHSIHVTTILFSPEYFLCSLALLYHRCGEKGVPNMPPPLRHRSLRAYAFLQSKLNLTFERPVAYRAVTSGALKLIAEHLVSRKYLLLY